MPQHTDRSIDRGSRIQASPPFLYLGFTRYISRGKNKRKERAQKGRRNHAVGTPYTPQSIGSPLPLYRRLFFGPRILSSGRLGLVFVRWDRTLRARPPSSHLDKRSPAPVECRGMPPRKQGYPCDEQRRGTKMDVFTRRLEKERERERAQLTRFHRDGGHRLSRCGKGARREQPTRSYDERERRVV